MSTGARHLEKPDTSSSISEDIAWILICWCLFWFGSCRSLGSERRSKSPTTDSLQRWPAPEILSGRSKGYDYILTILYIASQFGPVMRSVPEQYCTSMAFQNQNKLE
jgi:hypothetical protein